MYAIAFFATVILFSVTLFIGIKIAESVSKRKGSKNTHPEILLNPSSHLGLFRHSA